MSARLVLRTQTRAEHDRVDAIFSRLDLARAEDYRRFLTAQAAAYRPVEAALDEAGAAALLTDWPQRRRGGLLRADLDALGAALPPAIDPPHFDTAEAAWGAIYVLEGSRLGGALLRRQLPPHVPRAFLDADQAQGSWRKLLERLDEALHQPAGVRAAVESAKEVFARFLRAGQLYVEGRA